MSDIISSVTNIAIPALPCGIDNQLYGIQSEIANSMNALRAAYSPQNLVSNIAGLAAALKDKLANRIATVIGNSLPGFLPVALQDDIFNLVQSCALGPSPDCTNRLKEIENRWGNVNNLAEALASLVGGGDLCSKIPNISLFPDGSMQTKGLLGKMGNVVPKAIALPAALTDVAFLKGVKTIDKTLPTIGGRFSP